MTALRGPSIGTPKGQSRSLPAPGFVFSLSKEGQSWGFCYSEAPSCLLHAIALVEKDIGNNLKYLSQKTQ